jgi:hypothetical protein
MLEDEEDQKDHEGIRQITITLTLSCGSVMTKEKNCGMRAERQNFVTAVNI